MPRESASHESRPTDASRGERGRADKRQLILDAATKVFAQTGYHGSRVSDIAREAGVAYGLVYHYFQNKEKILDTIFEERWSLFLEAVEEIAEGQASTEDKLLAIAALILDAYRVRANWVKVLVFEIQRAPRFSQPEQIRAVGRLFEVVAKILRAGQQSGELRADVDPDMACYLFVGGLDIMVTSRVLGAIRLEGGARQASDYYLEVAHTVVDIFLRGLEDYGARGAGRTRAKGASDPWR
jgi:AcrR family transcriptional regulator